jgi:GTP1/Obg family GTP-binding protein
MDQERKAKEDISRASRAAEIINNPLYIEAITVMKAAMYEEFTDTKLIDDVQRHELWQRMQLMKQFEGRFESILKAGEKGRKTLSLLEKAKQKLNII